MVLAANDVSHSKIDVVDHAWQKIEPAPVFAADHGIAEQFGVELLLAADEVAPGDRRFMVEPEAPVRLATWGRRLVFSPALIDWRQAAPEQHLAAKLQLLGRL